ncbi:isoaspartyl peptidase/L-asparaginase [Chryseobacterium suipulveris]|uniref:Isoaspartyl peptidase/L-asparaginase n=1 Tax=Chryseobacterium suipulveris TaxID=2929800 RepID=A0ABY4C0T7_9FLAO|nr:isoaspartyl peptidase/L-asparaginase [Chryseobacterium suipulveris]UOE42370.1 isoaspartyl peptidase/L-asparaginase [Chryseobacterium suipulveris]
MKKTGILFALFFATLFYTQKKYVLVVHGGAGTITKENMTADKEKQYREKLTEALKAGYAEIQKGKSSVDAVAASIIILEDSPLFNAGKGAVFTADGKNELDASIMFGKDKSAGAVAGVHTIKNPIKAAIAVMKKSEHVMLSGTGAEQFAKEQGLEIVDPKYFWTKDRWEGLQKIKQKEALKTSPKTSQNKRPESYEIDQKFGTVGAVALDKNGIIAAGTSTGGMTNKKWNRIGDSPIIGAGTYANSQVGISGTGWGEFFIRSTAARTVAAKMEYQNKDIKSAAQETIEEIGKMGGDGGLIALDKDGNIAMPFNTAGMYRGAVTENGEIEVEIYKE